ncbi:MAG: response regulator transcription factor [Chloroflexota bacterium]
MPQTKILIVDDDPIIRRLLCRVLEADYLVTAAKCGSCAIEKISEDEFALGLLDIHLGDMNGIDLLQTLRERSPDTIFIMLTGQGSLETAVAALRHGAHDYLQKPFKEKALKASLKKGLQKRQEILQNRTLLNQIRAVQQTLEQIDNGQTTPTPSEPNSSQRFLEYGHLRIDLMRHRVTVNNQGVQLSPIEYKVLVFLAEAAPRVVSPQELVTAVQGHESETWEASEITRPHIYRIRQKIKFAAPKIEVIRTVRGVGYTLCD